MSWVMLGACATLAGGGPSLSVFAAPLLSAGWRRSPCESSVDPCGVVEGACVAAGSAGVGSDTADEGAEGNAAPAAWVDGVGAAQPAIASPVARQTTRATG